MLKDVSSIIWEHQILYLVLTFKNKFTHKYHLSKIFCRITKSENVVLKFVSFEVHHLFIYFIISTFWLWERGPLLMTWVGLQSRLDILYEAWLLKWLFSFKIWFSICTGTFKLQINRELIDQDVGPMTQRNTHVHWREETELLFILEGADSQMKIFMLLQLLISYGSILNGRVLQNKLSDKDTHVNMTIFRNRDNSGGVNSS